VAKKGYKAVKSGSKDRTPIALIVGIVVIAILVVLVLIQVGKPKVPAAGASDPSIPAGIATGLTPDGLATLGSSDAAVKVTIFEDYGCHNCKAFYDNYEADFIDQFIATGDVQLISYPVAFVNYQEQFWSYRHLLFINQGITPFTRDNLVDFAKTAGLNSGNFSSCYDQGKYKSQVRERTDQAFTLGVKGTPTFNIGGNLVEGVLPVDSMDPASPSLKQLIDPLLENN
jgi:protein-disulfide isomerase